LLAKLDGKSLPIEADQERLWTLLSVAYGHGVPLAVLGSLRRVAKHWQGGDKRLAAIHLAQMGLPGIGEDAAYRLALAAELIDAGVGPRELARELGFDPPASLLKYDPDQPRVPAGSGRESGQWTTSGDAAPSDAAGSPLTEGRSARTGRGYTTERYKTIKDLPKDAVAVNRPDGSFIGDLHFTAGFLMAPPNADFKRVYAAGMETAPTDVSAIIDAVTQGGAFDYQRDATNKVFYDAYRHAANYAVGVFMAGVGFPRELAIAISQTYAFFQSKQTEENRQQQVFWTTRGWDDGNRGGWR
jgi:hypothetical protein